ncbi:glycoside hydrolase family 2 protein [Dyadobacter sp. CY312]|uniref:glycoside hydrolase family 2 protein n=1 Tax=Dyadobacter sp. CY312 TaxID=2907303 RepID=UPI001F2B6AE1|nr:glycoside hydrolase family 2 TIM barrel-domain containing protein [Dyadobacter sp. CY312]MCE7040760.1 beta galactosidase jelly roll domain-containing protein [Dyadobacter sp. CY312]
MKRFQFQHFFLLILCIAQSSFAQYSIRRPDAIPLHGEWLFALDPANMGLPGKWYMQNVPQGGRFDKVTVPHSFSVDKRYEFYTGTVWYRKPFTWKPATNKRVILHFDAAYYKTDVWLNEQKVGSHEGGYTPFHFDVTDFLKEGNNILAVSVNNDTWQPGSIPGAKDDNAVNDPFVGWMNYGGLIRPVYFTIESEVYSENMKIDALPDLEKGTATIKTQLRIRNASTKPVSPKTGISVSFDQKEIPLKWKTKSVTIQPGQTGIVESETALTSAQVKLWNLDDPNLYQLKAFLGSDTLSSNFGIRKVEIKNVQLQLNGKPLKLGGGNRVVDYPKLGSLEPDWLIEKDFRLMKEAGMEFHRLTHYTPSEHFYDLADKYGMLIITEAGNWQLTPKLMNNDTIRKNFHQQFKEMAERDWNHPSVIAYSVGNEYNSLGDAGQRWTKDMIDYARNLDPTRLYTFATMLLNTLPKKPEDEASQYVDFVSTNTYGNHAKALDHIHALYPEKPILISEWGLRADSKEETTQGLLKSSEHDFGSSEVVQAKHVSEVVAEIRKRPYVIGASWWTYNDYQSRFHGSNPNGYRPWGIVRPDRSLRPAYYVYQKEMSPVTIEKTGFKVGDQGEHVLTLKVTARNDFPAYAIQGYYIQTSGKSVNIPNLNPGESKEIEIAVKGFDKNLKINIFKPTGFKVLDETIDLK